MKFLIGILIVILSITLSNVLSEKFTVRKKFFYDFNSFNEKLKTEVSFSQRTINSILSDDNNSDFYRLACKILIDKENIEKIPFLKKDETDFFKEYLSSVGKSDKENQLNYLSVSSNQLLINKTNAENEEKKYKSLYIKLGFLFGLIIFVIIL